MICAGRSCAYAVCLSFFVGAQVVAAAGKTGKEDKPVASVEASAVNTSSREFRWEEHNKLSWDDFKGPVAAETERSAAATHCGIGFRTITDVPGGKPSVIVYNTFYTSKSWVRPDARIASILDHEQGHFDLCEIYTRKLRTRMSQFDFGTADNRQALMAIYNEITGEYENQQRAYEQETIHGTNTTAQQRWQQMMQLELRTRS